MLEKKIRFIYVCIEEKVWLFFYWERDWIWLFGILVVVVCCCRNGWFKLFDILGSWCFYDWIIALIIFYYRLVIMVYII